MGTKYLTEVLSNAGLNSSVVGSLVLGSLISVTGAALVGAKGKLSIESEFEGRSCLGSSSVGMDDRDLDCLHLQVASWTCCQLAQS